MRDLPEAGHPVEGTHPLRREAFPLAVEQLEDLRLRPEENQMAFLSARALP